MTDPVKKLILAVKAYKTECAYKPPSNLAKKVSREVMFNALEELEKS